MWNFFKKLGFNFHPMTDLNLLNRVHFSLGLWGKTSLLTLAKSYTIFATTDELLDLKNTTISVNNVAFIKELMVSEESKNPTVISTIKDGDMYFTVAVMITNNYIVALKVDGFKDKNKAQATLNKILDKLQFK